MAIKTMGFRDKNGSIISEIVVRGGPEKVTVELKYGSSIQEERTISLHPGMQERLLFWVLNVDRHTSNHNTTRGLNDKERFEAIIQNTIEEYSVLARSFVKKEEDRSAKINEDKKTREEKYEEFKKFLDTIPSPESKPVALIMDSKGTAEFEEDFGERSTRQKTIYRRTVLLGGVSGKRVPALLKSWSPVLLSL